MSLAVLGGTASVSAGDEAESADNRRAIDLKQALTIMIAENPQLGARVEAENAARERVRQAQGVDDFVLVVSGEWKRRRRELFETGTPVSGQLSADFLVPQEPESDSVRATFGVRRALPTGGEVGVEAIVDYRRNTFSGQFDSVEGLDTLALNEYIPSVGVYYEQPLLRGLGTDSARRDLEQARRVRDQRTRERERTTAELLRDTVIAYGELWFADQELAARRLSADAARTQLEVTSAYIREQRLPESAVAEVQIAVAFRADEVASSRYSADLRALELGERLGAKDAVVLYRAADTLALPALVGAGPAVDAARSASPELAVAQAVVRAAEARVNATANDRLPALDLSVRAGPSGYARNGLGDAFDQVVGFDGYTLTLGLTYEHPIRRREGRGRHGAARAELRKARLEATTVQNRITAQVKGRYREAVAARQRIEVLAQAVDAAKTDVDAEEARFRAGRGSNFDVLRRHANMAESRIRLARARADYVRAVATLEAITGGILDRYGVTLP
ncbi:MAG: TolC family protein [Myxococcota bacterium]